MLGFYIGLAVALLLFVAGYFAWTPLRVWYIEHSITSDHAAAYSQYDTRVPRARQLLDIGPAGESALRRLLATGEFKSVVLEAMNGQQHLWALPLAINTLSDSDEYIAIKALSAALRTVGTSERGITFVAPTDIAALPAHDPQCRMVFDPGAGRDVVIRADHVPTIRKRVLDWWEREGKAKYGRDGE